MKKEINAGLKRLFGSFWYILGLVIALLVTLWFTKNGRHVSVFRMENDNEAMYFVCCAIFAFFSLFTPLFINTEYEDGVIRNKVIAGHKQSEIYIVQLFVQLVAVFVMQLCWIAGGLLGGARIDSALLVSMIVVMFAQFGYVAFLTFIGMKLRKRLYSSVLGVLACYALISTMLIGNYIVSISEGIMFMIFNFIYHLSPIGQWFLYSYVGSDTLWLPLFVEILISLVELCFWTLVGMIGINKRELV